MMVDGLAEVVIDTKGENDFWTSGLILFATGKDLSMNAVKHFIGKVWKFVSMPDLYYHEDDYFIVRFMKPEDRDAVMANNLTQFSRCLYS